MKTCSLPEARTRVREALGPFVSNAPRVPLADEIRLPDDTRRDESIRPPKGGAP